jgi:hypothetical protein
MNLVTIPKWSACITIGRYRGYTKELIGPEEFKRHLKDIQETQIRRERLYLSANMFLSDIMLSGHEEPHVNLHFINYPRFPTTEDPLKKGVIEIATYLKEKLEQNRVLIIFDSEITMLEESPEIDKGISSPDIEIPAG